MIIPIIAGQVTGLYRALLNMGYRDMKSIVWHRSPVRINGVWQCEVKR